MGVSTKLRCMCGDFEQVIAGIGLDEKHVWRRSSADAVSYRARTFDEKHPFPISDFASVKGTGVLYDRVLQTGQYRTSKRHNGYAGSDCLATATISPKAAESRTARSASILRSTSTPAADSP